jgi:hypothetical protein
MPNWWKRLFSSSEKESAGAGVRVSPLVRIRPYRPPPSVTAAHYLPLLKCAQQQDPKSDFYALRMAFVQTSDYDPSHGTLMGKIAEMNKAWKDGNHMAAAKFAMLVLAKEFVFIQAHHVAAMACMAIGKAEKAAFHFWAREGLVNSILESGDGRSAASGFVVINREEEYALLDALGLESVSHGIGHEGASPYHILEARAPKTGEIVSLFFKIDIFYR